MSKTDDSNTNINIPNTGVTPADWGNSPNSPNTGGATNTPYTGGTTSIPYVADPTITNVPGVITTTPNTGTNPFYNASSFGSGDIWANDQIVELDGKDLEDRLRGADNPEEILAAYAKCVIDKQLGKDTLKTSLENLSRILANAWDFYFAEMTNGRMFYDGSFKLYVKVQG